MCRAYIAYVRLLDWEFDDEFGEMCSKSWLEARQRDSLRPSSEQFVSQDLFANWLTICRYLSVSYGETTGSEGRWTEMRAMEDQRMARVDKGWAELASTPASELLEKAEQDQKKKRQADLMKFLEEEAVGGGGASGNEPGKDYFKKIDKYE